MAGSHVLCSQSRLDPVFLVRPWMLALLSVLRPKSDPASRDVWRMDGPISEQIQPWMSSWLGDGWSVLL